MVRMTDQQLRALGKKHLLVIIRDLEKDLQKAVLDKEELMLAYQCGLTQNHPQPQYAARENQIQPQDVWQMPGTPQYTVQYAQPQWTSAAPQPAYPYTGPWQ